MSRYLKPLFTVCLLCLLHQGIAANEISTDVSVEAATLADDEDIFSGASVLAGLPGLPSSTDLVAHHRKADGTRLFLVDTSVDLLGGEVAFPGDVTSFDGVVYSNVWRASIKGLPGGVMTDAVTDIGGELLLSFDTSVKLGDVHADDEDLVLIAGGGPQLFLDASSQGIDEALDLDAASYHPAESGLLFLSFDGSGQVGGIDFDDEDVLRYRLSDNQWSLYFNGTDIYAATDIDAFHAVIEMFHNGFEANQAPSGPTTVQIDPAVPTTTSDLICLSSGAADPDSNSISLNYKWFRNGSQVGAFSAVLRGSLTIREDTLRCEVQADDGAGGQSNFVASASVVVTNSVPSNPGVNLVPVLPLSGDTLICEITTLSTDADADALTYSYRWFNNGSQTGNTTNVTPDSQTAAGQSYRCEVLADDGIDLTPWIASPERIIQEDP